MGCDKAFAQLSNLQQHQKNHENKKAAEEQRPFFCRICDRRFSSDNGLTKHIAKVSYPNCLFNFFFQNFDFCFSFKKLEKNSDQASGKISLDVISMFFDVSFFSSS